MSLALLVAAAVLPCAVLLGAYFWRFGDDAEPRRRVFGALIAGGGAFAIAVAVGRLLPPTDNDWVRAFAQAGVVEEALKLAAALLVAPAPRRMERFSAGITYLVVAAVGFAAVETVVYGASYGLGPALARGVTALPAHVFPSALIGVAVGRAHRVHDAAGATAGIAVAFLAAVLLHGLYDLLLIQESVVRFGLPALLTAEAAVVVALLVGAHRRDVVSDLDQLRSAALLKDVDFATIRLLQRRARRHALRPGDVVVREGEGGESLFVVLRGTLRVDRDGELAEWLADGDVFGEGALFSDQVRGGTVTADVDALVLAIPRSVVLEALTRSAVLAPALLDEAGFRTATVLPSVEELLAEAGDDTRRKVDQLDPLTARLASVGLFADVPPSALWHLRDTLVERTIPAGKRVPEDGLSIVLRGTAEIRRGDEFVDALAPGDVLGEIPLLTGLKATVEVVAGPGLQVASLDWATLRDVVALHPELGVALLEQVLARVSLVREAGVESFRRSPFGKLLLLVQVRDDIDRELSPYTTARNVMDELVTRAHLDMEGLRALTVALKQTRAPEFGLSPTGGLRKVGPDGLASGERGLGRKPLEDALARAPELLRVLASQVVRATEEIDPNGGLTGKAGSV